VPGLASSSARQMAVIGASASPGQVSGAVGWQHVAQHQKNLGCHEPGNLISIHRIAQVALQGAGAVAWLKGFTYPANPLVHRDVAFEGNHIVSTDESGIPG